MYRIRPSFVKLLKTDSYRVFNRQFSQTDILHSSQNAPNKHFVKFEDLIHNRRKEARKSIVVQVLSEKSFPELHSYCSQFGKIKQAHHYRMNNYNGNYNYILIEFSHAQQAEDAIKSSCYTTDFQNYNSDSQIIPVQSPFLYFGKGKSNPVSSNVQLNSTDGNKRISENGLVELLQAAETIDDQIKILYESTKLNELGIRLRFLAALQIERAVSGMFPHVVAYPFGSSMNGFGKMGCDLDLILRIDVDKNEEKGNKSRLIFHTKEFLSNARLQTQKNIDRMGDILELFLPGVGNVRRILKARIPIVKYNHELLDLEIDLSMSNLSGVYMSELLFLFGEMDNRVRPLVFVIRKWAESVGLTNSFAGPWITNFSITSLVLFYLQQIKNPILPPINLLIKNAGPEDQRITSDDINCTFLRDLNKLTFKTRNQDSLGKLLFQFFEFYSQFDFSNRAMSLNEARTVFKPDDSAMYIINPLELGLNVSKNVSLAEVDRFRVEVRNAVWFLESCTDTQSVSKQEHQPWGLLYLFKTLNANETKQTSVETKKPLVDVKRLFDDDDSVSIDHQYARKSRNLNTLHSRGRSK